MLRPFPPASPLVACSPSRPGPIAASTQAAASRPQRSVNCKAWESPSSPSTTRSPPGSHKSAARQTCCTATASPRTSPPTCNSPPADTAAPDTTAARQSTLPSPNSPAPHCKPHRSAMHSSWPSPHSAAAQTPNPTTSPHHPSSPHLCPFRHKIVRQPTTPRLTTKPNATSSCSSFGVTI